MDRSTINRTRPATRYSLPKEPLREQEPRPPGIAHPKPIAERIAVAAVEVLHGFRAVGQLQRWLAPELYNNLVQCSGLARRCGSTLRRPCRIMRSRACYPAPGVCEATVIVHDTHKPRACALRLQIHRGRWRVTTLDII